MFTRPFGRRVAVPAFASPERPEVPVSWLRGSSALTQMWYVTNSFTFHIRYYVVYAIALHGCRPANTYGEDLLVLSNCLVSF